MTNVNAQYARFAGNMRRITRLQGGDFGVAPDKDHLDSGGYHVGPDDIRRIGRWLLDYSTRQSRDKIAGNDASAFDVGDDWPNGGRPAWLRWNNMFLRQLQVGDPALASIRAINVSRDGVERKRYDTLHRDQGLIDSADGVYMHTHGETWRDQAGTPGLDRAFRRIEQMADAAVRNIPLPPEGNDDMGNTWIEPLTQGTPGYAGQQRDTALAFTWQASAEAAAGVGRLEAAAAADEVRDNVTLAAVKALVVATGGDPQPVLDAIAAARAETHDLITQLQVQVADVQARNAKLAAALAAAGGALDDADA